MDTIYFSIYCLLVELYLFCHCFFTNIYVEFRLGVALKLVNTLRLVLHKTIKSGEGGPFGWDPPKFSDPEK